MNKLTSTVMECRAASEKSGINKTDAYALEEKVKKELKMMKEASKEVTKHMTSIGRARANSIKSSEKRAKKKGQPDEESTTAKAAAVVLKASALRALGDDRWADVNCSADIALALAGKSIVKLVGGVAAVKKKGRDAVQRAVRAARDDIEQQFFS